MFMQNKDIHASNHVALGEQDNDSDNIAPKKKTKQQKPDKRGMSVVNPGSSSIFANPSQASFPSSNEAKKKKKTTNPINEGLK